MAPPGRSIFRIANDCSARMGAGFLWNGPTSTCEPGRKAEAPPRSTVKPPRTRPTMEPVTGPFLAWAASRRVQASPPRRAGLREKVVAGAGDRRVRIDAHRELRNIRPHRKQSGDELPLLRRCAEV